MECKKSVKSKNNIKVRCKMISEKIHIRFNNFVLQFIRLFNRKSVRKEDGFESKRRK